MAQRPQRKMLISVGTCCAWSAFFATIMTFAFSFHVVKPREFGIIFDNNFRDLDGAVWEHGRFFLGLGRVFVLFPRGLINIEYMKGGTNLYDGTPTAYQELSCWTKNGQAVNVEVSLQLRIVEENMIQLYNQWGDMTMALWHLQSSITRTIKDASVMLETETYFSARGEVKIAFEQAITAMLLDDEFYKLEKFQLRQISLPIPFEQAIVNKMLTFQDIALARQLQEQYVVEEQTLKVSTDVEMDALITLKNASALGHHAKTTASVYGTKEMIEARAMAYTGMVNALGFAEAGSNLAETLQKMHFFMYGRMCDTPECKGVKKVSGLKGDLLGF